jgi:hypothetical protein
MSLTTYRFVVLGSLFSSFMVGLHMPAMHEIIEHGADTHWGIVAATGTLVAMTIAGGWALLRRR